MTNEGDGRSNGRYLENCTLESTAQFWPIAAVCVQGTERLGGLRPKAVIKHDARGVPNYPCACGGTFMLPMTMRKAISTHMQA